MHFTEISIKIYKNTAYGRKSWKVTKIAALGFQLFIAQKSIRLRFTRLHVNHLNKKDGIIVSGALKCHKKLLVC